MEWNYVGCDWQNQKKNWSECVVRREIWGLGGYSRGKRSLEGAQVDLASSPSWPPSGAVGTRLAAFQNRD